MRAFSMFACFLAFSSFFLVSCEDNSTSASTVSGMVADPQGEPMADVRVKAERQGGIGGLVQATTDQQGRYSLQGLAQGSWKIYARKEVQYKGNTYDLRMGMPEPSDYKAFEAGAGSLVKNFEWQLSGEIPDRPHDKRAPGGYFGGTIICVIKPTPPNPLPTGTVVTISLTPVSGATLLDGSTPQSIQKTFTIEDGEVYDYYIHDIPQSEYRITATSTEGTSVKPLQLSDESLLRGFADAVEGMYFRRDPMYTISYESGLLSFYLYMML